MRSEETMDASVGRPAAGVLKQALPVVKDSLNVPKAPRRVLDCPYNPLAPWEALQGRLVTLNVRFGAFEVRGSERVLLADGAVCPIGSRAMDVLLALIERRDRVVTKNELLDLAWPGLVVEENNLSVQISALRKALGASAIATVAGRGYRFALP